jgi:hypothetical protein
LELVVGWGFLFLFKKHHSNQQTNSAPQLACAVADLALQMRSWAHPVPDLIALMGAGAPAALLDILVVVPEDVHYDMLHLTVR